MNVSEEVLAERRERLISTTATVQQPANVAPALRAYAAMALSADKGAVRDVDRVERAPREADEREAAAAREDTGASEPRWVFPGIANAGSAAWLTRDAFLPRTTSPTVMAEQHQRPSDDNY